MSAKKRSPAKSRESPSKKSKGDAQESPQRGLAYYFSKNKGKAKQVDEVIELSSDDSGEDRDHLATPTTPRVRKNDLTQVERDAQLAAELAKSEGIDVEHLRRQDEIYARQLNHGENALPGPSKPSALFPKGSTSEQDSDNTRHGPFVSPIGKSKLSSNSTFFPTLSTSSPENVVYPLDKDVFAFDPSTDIDTRTWPRHHRTKAVQIPYSFLTAAFVLISATRSRLLIVTILTNTLRSIIRYQPNALVDAVYLITNHVAPSYEGVELGIGGQILTKAIKEVSGISAKEMKSLWHQVGVRFVSSCLIDLLY
jgi:DNA ligase-1